LEEIRTAIETAVRGTPPGEVVYLGNRPYRGAGAAATAFPQYFPGWTAVFCMLHPENTVDGRRVRFVEPRAAVRAAAGPARRSAELLVAAAPPGAMVW
jgi:hypothetical protein